MQEALALYQAPVFEPILCNSERLSFTPKLKGFLCVAQDLNAGDCREDRMYLIC